MFTRRAEYDVGGLVARFRRKFIPWIPIPLVFAVLAGTTWFICLASLLIAAHVIYIMSSGVRLYENAIVLKRMFKTATLFPGDIEYMRLQWAKDYIVERSIGEEMLEDVPVTDARVQIIRIKAYGAKREYAFSRRLYTPSLTPLLDWLYANNVPRAA